MASDAAVCRANGWGVGALLEGDEGFGPTVIQITAVGERVILAKAVSHAAKAINRDEAVWSLAYRDWRKVGDA